MDLRINNFYLKFILKYNTHTQIYFMIDFHIFNLNRTKYTLSQEFDVNLDLTEVFSLKKSPIAVQT